MCLVFPPFATTVPHIPAVLPRPISLYSPLILFLLFPPLSVFVFSSTYYYVLFTFRFLPFSSSDFLCFSFSCYSSSFSYSCSFPIPISYFLFLISISYFLSSSSLAILPHSLIITGFLFLFLVFLFLLPSLFLPSTFAAFSFPVFPSKYLSLPVPPLTPHRPPNQRKCGPSNELSSSMS